MAERINKNQAMVNFLLACKIKVDGEWKYPFRGYKFYFNFGNIKNNDKQLVAHATDKALNKPYIDGSVQKQFQFSIVDFKSVGYNAIIKTKDGTSVDTNKPDENISDLFDVQLGLDALSDNEVRRLANDVDEDGNPTYAVPDFGEDCQIDSISTTQNSPNLEGVDTSATPALAQYSITVSIEYLDTSGVITR